MKQRYILLAIAALVFAACARNTKPSEPEGMMMTFTAYQEGTGETRTTVQAGGTQVYWEPADEIKVFFNGAGGRFIAQNTENATVATFSGTLNVVVGGNEGAGYSTKTWGLYPYRADAVLDGDAMVTTLPSDQTGRAGSFAKNMNITLAQSEGYGLPFYNVCGGVRFSLTQEGIKRVTFEGNGGETLAGRIKLAFADGLPVVSEVVARDSILTLTPPGGGTFQTGQWYYFSALPGSLPQGYKMVFYKETESAKLVSSSSVTIRRGAFGSLTDADEGLIFKPTGSGEEPDPGDFIQFVDPIAKYACVDKFDSNHDGEVSYAEAAAATTLSGLFTDWNTVTSFDEIKFFTGVTSISGVFTGLAQLKHITVPDWITTLGNYTFQNCSALDTVALPAALSSLPTYCFAGCSALKDVTLPMSITSIPNGCFRNCAVLTTVALPSTVTSLGQYAFSGCTLLSGVDLPSGYKTIGNYAFQSCQAIAAMDFPSSLTSIGQGAFSGCTGLTSVSVGNGVYIGQDAFDGCSSMTSAIVGGGSSIGPSAFNSCTSMTSVVIGSGCSIGAGAFIGCSALISASLENSVSLGQYAFSGCTKLASVMLPDSLTSIPDYCFQNCTALATIAWPQALTSIGEGSFAGCRFADTNYTLELPATITSIGSAAFGTTRHLIVPSTTPVNIETDSFGANYSFLYVPANLVEMYKVRTNWSNYADRIRSISEYAVEPRPTVGGLYADAVDLGLSVKWASWNIGAASPEDYGVYFAWGETVPKEDYTWSNYKWCNGSTTTLTKYNTKTANGTVDNKTTLDPDDDAAHVNWGGTWRMPTQAEFRELISNCNEVMTTENGVYGRRFTSKKEGYTDKSIFVPAAGHFDGSFLSSRSYGYYWSSSLYTSNLARAYTLEFYSSSVSVYYVGRHFGQPVRPVTE